MKPLKQKEDSKNTNLIKNRAVTAACAFAGQAEQIEMSKRHCNRSLNDY